MRIRSLNSKIKELEKLDVMKTTFIRALGREIRTPLHSVSGMAEIIAREDLYLSKSEKKSISGKIQYNASMISTLLDEVAVYSEGGDGHHLQDERFSPNQLIQRCLDGNRPFVQNGVRLTFRHDLPDDVFVSADRHIVEVVLNKLVFTSCRFTSEGEVAAGCYRDKSSSMIFFSSFASKYVMSILACLAPSGFRIFVRSPISYFTKILLSSIWFLPKSVILSEPRPLSD